MVVRFIVSAVAGGIVMFILGFLIYGLALDPWMKANIAEYAGLMKETPDFIALAGMNIVWAGLIAFVADNWAKARDFGSGMKVGGILMFFAAIAMNLGYTAFWNLFQSVLVPLVDSVVMTFMGVVVGGVIGVVLGKMHKS
jgi:site-specific recombinase